MLTSLLLLHCRYKTLFRKFKFYPIRKSLSIILSMSTHYNPCRKIKCSFHEWSEYSKGHVFHFSSAYLKRNKHRSNKIIKILKILRMWNIDLKITKNIPFYRCITRGIYASVWKPDGLKGSKLKRTKKNIL